MSDRFAAARGGRRRRALRGLRAVPLPGVGAEEPGPLAVGRAVPAGIRRSRRLGALGVPHRMRGRPRGATRLAVRVRGLQVQQRAVEAVLCGRDGRPRSARAARSTASPGCRGTKPSSGRSTSHRCSLFPLAAAQHEERVVLRGRRRARGARRSRCRRRRSAGATTGADRARGASRRRMGRRARRPGEGHGVASQNATDAPTDDRRREQALRRALIAVHVLLAVDDGAFVSSLDPGDDAARAVAGCTNDGTFPVLVGADDRVECWRRRSSSTTTPRSRPRAKAISATPPRSTRSSPSVSSP